MRWTFLTIFFWAKHVGFLCEGGRERVPISRVVAIMHVLSLLDNRNKQFFYICRVLHWDKTFRNKDNFMRKTIQI